MITEEKEWIQQNLVHIEKISSEHKSFNLLQDYCIELIIDNPRLLLKSNDITIIEKSTLLTILKSDFLELDEIEETPGIRVAFQNSCSFSKLFLNCS